MATQAVVGSVRGCGDGAVACPSHVVAVVVGRRGRGAACVWDRMRLLMVVCGVVSPESTTCHPSRAVRVCVGVWDTGEGHAVDVRSAAVRAVRCVRCSGVRLT